MRVWMAEARNLCGLTMKAVARELGISESNYCMIERGYRQRKLNLSVANKLSKIFGVSLEYIISQENDPIGAEPTAQSDTKGSSGQISSSG